MWLRTPRFCDFAETAQPKMVARIQCLSVLLLASSALVSGWSTFTVPHIDGQDDTPGLLNALSTGNFTANSTILFKKGITYNIFTPIKFPTLHNVEVAIEGNLTYPADIPTVQGKFVRLIFE